MSLTPAQSEQIILIRNQLMQMMTAIDQIARETGAMSAPAPEVEAFNSTLRMSPMSLRQPNENNDPVVFFEAPGVVNGVPQEPEPEPVFERASRSQEDSPPADQTNT
jgi:hypothetical protein